MALVLDPVGSSLIQSLAHPGGNVTGLSMMATELYPKRLQLLKDIIPKLTRVAVLWNPDHPFHAKAVEELKSVAPSGSIELSFAAARTPEQFDSAFSDVTQARAQALYVVEDPIFFAHRMALLKLTSAARLPTIHELSRWPEASALISYGPDLHDLFRRAAIYVDRILKGTKPADLPVEQPTKFELVIKGTLPKVIPGGEAPRPHPPPPSFTGVILALRVTGTSHSPLSQRLFFAIFFAIFLRPTEQICPDSARPFIGFDPVGWHRFGRGPIRCRRKSGPPVRAAEVDPCSARSKLGLRTALRATTEAPRRG
jgi:ABC transporter substrate binding protein